MRILYPKPFFRGFPYFNGWCESIRLSPQEPDAEDIAKYFPKEPGTTYCLFLHELEEKNQLLQAYEPLLRQHGLNLLYAHGKKEKTQKYFFIFKYIQKQITMHFTKDR